MPETTVNKSTSEYETKEGTKESVQFTTTIPKQLVEAFGVSDKDTLTWTVETGNAMRVEVD